MPSRLKDLRLRFPYDDQAFVKNIPQDTLVHLHWNTREMSRRAPVQQMRVWKTIIPFSSFRTMILTALKIFFYVRRRTYLFTRSIEPRSIARHWRFRQENIHWIQLIYAAWPSESWPVGLPSTKWSLESTFLFPNLVLFYFILFLVFLHPKAR